MSEQSDAAFENWKDEIRSLNPGRDLMDYFWGAKAGWDAALAYAREPMEKCGHPRVCVIERRMTTCSDHEIDPECLGQCGEVIDDCIDCGWKSVCIVCEDRNKARDEALKEVETIAELYHNPVGHAIMNEIRVLREKKA